MPRTVPVAATQNAGNLITAALWNASVTASNTFLTGVPICSITQSVAQALTNNTLTAIQFDTTITDTDSQHSNSVNNTRITCQVAGWYWAYGMVGFTANATGSRVAQLHKNGSGIINAQVWIINDGLNPTSVVSGALVQLAVGDYIELFGFQTSGGSLNTQVNGPQSLLNAVWVHS